MAITDIDPDTPRGSDPFRNGDDEIRQFKRDVKESFPNISGAVVRTHEELNKSLQTLSIDGNNLTISDGNTVTLPDSGSGPGDIYAKDVIHEPTLTPEYYTVQEELDYLHGEVQTNGSNIADNSNRIGALESRQYAASEILDDSGVTCCTNLRDTISNHESRLDNLETTPGVVGNVIGMAVFLVAGEIGPPEETYLMTGVIEAINSTSQEIRIDISQQSSKYSYITLVSGDFEPLYTIYQEPDHVILNPQSGNLNGVHRVIIFGTG